MSYPRKYPISTGAPLDENDWNAVVAHIYGVTVDGVFAYPWNYLIRNSGGKIEAINYVGALVYGGADDEGDVDGTDFSAVLQACADTLTTGGVIQIESGEFYADTTITLTNDGIWVRGAGGAGDYQLTADATENGYLGRNRTVIYDNDAAGLTSVFQVGSDSVCIKGVSITDLAISGTDVSTGLDDDEYKTGACIMTLSARAGCKFERLGLYRKTYGVIFTRRSGDYTYLKNNEGILVRDVTCAYMDKAIYHSFPDLIVDSTFANISGYYCENGLVNLHDAGVQNCSFIDIRGQVCGYAVGAVAMGIKADGAISIINPQFDNNQGETYSGYAGIYLTFESDSGHGRGVVNITAPAIHGFSHGIFVPEGDSSTGVVNVYVPYLGLMPGADQAPLGGSVGLTYKLFYNLNPNCEVYIHGGVGSTSNEDGAKYAYRWFQGVTKISNMHNFNPCGVIPTPFGSGTIGLYGGAGVSASTDFTVTGVDILLNSSGGTGVSITVKDAAGTTVASGLATCTALFLPVGSVVNFGAFSGAPTVVVFGC